MQLENENLKLKSQLQQGGHSLGSGPTTSPDLTASLPSRVSALLPQASINRNPLLAVRILKALTVSYVLLMLACPRTICTLLPCL